MQVTISIPDALYAELQEVAAASEEYAFGPAEWAGELIASELAARRLPRVSPGGRVKAAKPVEPGTYRIVMPRRLPHV